MERPGCVCCASPEDQAVRPALPERWHQESVRIFATFLFALTLPAAAAAECTRVLSPQIEVLTDAGEKTGRQVLGRFDEIRRIFRQTNAPDSPLALRVFVFASEKEFRVYREDSATDGFYQSAPERDYIALYAAADAGRVVVHEYVHLVLSHSSGPLPKWFEEGTAEFYS